MDRIGRYEIESEIGRGSLGVVYRAYDPMVERPVAINVLAPQADPNFSSLFAAKVAVAAKLTHKNIVAIFDIGEEQGVPYVVMEFLKGSDLRQLLRQSPPLTLFEKIDILSEAAEGLQYAHEHGVIHGGLRLSNIRRMADGSVKLLDFGIGLVIHGSPNAYGDYLSPERVEGYAADELSDIWAFGVVLYKLLTGRSPFSTPFQTATEDPAPIETLVRDCPPLLASMAARLLKKNRDGRYQNMADVAMELSAAKSKLAAHEISALLERIPQLLETQDLDAAQSVVRSVLDLDPSNADARLLRENLHRSVEAARKKPEYVIRFKAQDQMPAAKSDVPLNPVDEDVQFSVYRPRAVPPDVWKTLLVFAHRTAKPHNASEPDPVQEVQRQAELILGEQIREYPKVSQDSAQAIPRQGVLTFLPEVEGVTFQPNVQSVTWTGRVPPAIFLLSSTSEHKGRTLRGHLCVFLGNIVVAQVPLAILVEESTGLPEASYVSDQVRWYRRIFASYSHQDTAIVEEFENHAIAFGDDYLRDLKTLRAGSDWNEGLRRMIREADVFQLFWSHNSMNSKYVRQEYNYALSLGREGFVRPVYWEVPMPQSKESGLPPAALQALHFHRIAVSAVKAPPAVRVSNPGGVWYYLEQGKTAGPVERAAFETLVRQGVVRDDTLVWKEGMADWKPYSTVRPAALAAAPTVVTQMPPPQATWPQANRGSVSTSKHKPVGEFTAIFGPMTREGHPQDPAPKTSDSAPSRPQTPEDLRLSAASSQGPAPSREERKTEPLDAIPLSAAPASDYSRVIRNPPRGAQPESFAPPAPEPAPAMPAAMGARGDALYPERSAPKKSVALAIALSVMVVLLVGVSGSLFMRTARRPSDPGMRHALATAQIRSFATALGAYKSDTGTFPTTSQGLTALRAKPADTRGWDGPYLGQDIPLDPWGRAYLYKFPGDHGDRPDIISLGADGRAGGNGENADVVSWQQR